jgi:PhnB protein
MAQLVPYLTIPRRTREALDFYKRVFGGEVLALMTFGEMDPNAGEMADSVMHSHFKSDAVEIMISEGMPDDESNPTAAVSLALMCADRAEQDRHFNALSQGGTVRMPLNDVPWGRYGEVIDPFGFRWLLNAD